jgi:hypothetical protein
MSKYRKLPVEIEAVQFVEKGHGKTNMMEVWEFMGRPDEHVVTLRPPGVMAIHTLEGTMQANPGDYIIKGVRGEFYPVKSDIFEATYRPSQP